MIFEYQVRANPAYKFSKASAEVSLLGKKKSPYMLTFEMCTGTSHKYTYQCGRIEVCVCVRARVHVCVCACKCSRVHVCARVFWLSTPPTRLARHTPPHA